MYFEGFTIQGARTKLSDRKFVKNTLTEVDTKKSQSELPLTTDSILPLDQKTSSDVSNFKVQLKDILNTLK